MVVLPCVLQAQWKPRNTSRCLFVVCVFFFLLSSLGGAGSHHLGDCTNDDDRNLRNATHARDTCYKS